MNDTTQEVANPPTRRRLAAAAGLMLMTGLSGCNKTGSTAAVPLHCEPAVPMRINRKFLFDRTTVPPDGMVERIVRYLQGGLKPTDHLQILAFAGVTPSLIEEVARFQMPARADDPQQRERDRWSKSPAQIVKDQKCEVQVLEALNLGARLRSVLLSTDGAVQARSPIFEAIAAAVQGWSGQALELELWSDGVEHLSAERSFYGQAGGLKLPHPDAWIEQLRREQLLPDLRGVVVSHLAIGMNEVAGNTARGLRRYPDVVALKQLWRAYWQATGAKQLRFSEPLPVDGTY